MQPTNIQRSLSLAKADPSIAWARFHVNICCEVEFVSSLIGRVLGVSFKVILVCLNGGEVTHIYLFLFLLVRLNIGFIPLLEAC